MKITKSRLQQIIKEEFKNFTEVVDMGRAPWKRDRARATSWDRVHRADQLAKTYRGNPSSQRADMEAHGAEKTNISGMMEDLLQALHDIGDFEHYEQIEAIKNSMDSPAGTSDDEGRAYLTTDPPHNL